MSGSGLTDVITIEIPDWWRIRTDDYPKSIKKFLPRSDKRPIAMPTGQPFDNDEEQTLAPTLSFGNYQLLEPLEKGGMGVVYRALQKNPRREVALKRIRTGIDATEEHIARFKIEVESVANFQHPNIVRVFEFGEHNGELYYSMPLINGGSLHRKLRREQRLSCRSAAEITRTLADALAYAHQRKIIHRDLKPANILFDDAQNPMIIDFGLAKRLEKLEEKRDEAPKTEEGIPIGTYRYMPPEQLKRPAEADERADIFSLGAVLYECLVGRSLYPGAEAIDIIGVLDDPTFEPARPRGHRPEIDRELEAICLKCLKWDASQRYPTARALFDDLDRYLRGDETSVLPRTPAQRLVSWCREHPAIASALATIVLVVTPLSLVVNQVLFSKSEELAKTVQQRDEAIVQLDEIVVERDRTIEERDRTIRELNTANAKLDRATRIADERRYIDRIREADRAHGALRPAEAQQILNSIRAEIEDLDQMTQFEWGYLRQVTNTDRHAIVLTHTDAVRCVTVGPDGSVLFSDSEGDIYIAKANGPSWAIQENPYQTFDGGIAEIAVGRQARRLAVGTETQGQLHLLPQRPQRESWPRAINGDPITRVAVAPNGTYVVGATESGCIGIFLENGNAIPDEGTPTEQSGHDGAIFALDVGYIHEMLYVVSGGRDGQVKFWQFDEEGAGDNCLTEVASIAFESVILSLAIHPDMGNRIVVGTQDGRLHQWHVSDGIEDGEGNEGKEDQVRLKLNSHSSVLVGHKNPLYSVAYNRNGDQLVTASEDGVVRFWNPEDLTIQQALPGHNGPVWDVSFLPSALEVNAESSKQASDLDLDRRVVSVGEDKTIRIWTQDTTGTPLDNRSLLMSPIESLSFSKDGQRLLFANGDDQIQVWDVSTREPLEPIDARQSTVTAICLEPQSGKLALLDIDGQIRILSEPEFETSIDSPLIDAKAKSIAFTPDGSSLAALTADGQLVWYDLDNLRPEAAREFQGIRGIISTADTLLATFDDGSLRAIIDREKTQVRASPFQLGTQEKFAISRNGSRWIRSNAGQVELWAALSQARILNLTPDDVENQRITQLAFSPDGQSISCGDSLGNVWIWEASER